MIIDTHMHADARSSEDFEIMYTSGVDVAITCSYYPYKLRSTECLLNHFDRIRKFDTKRAQGYGLKLKVALGIHPANANLTYEPVLEELKTLILDEKIKIIGEIGLDSNTSQEQEVFKKQLELADELQTPVIIHTPRKNKAEVLKDIIKIVDENINPKLVVVDHINPNIVESVIDKEYMLGLTVQPQKMSVDECVSILDNYGFDKFLLNSDISNKPSDPLSVPKTVRTLEKLDYKISDIDKVSFENAFKFFKI